MNTFDDITKKVEEIAYNPKSIGLKGGVMGAVLFFMYYQRFSANGRYEEISYNLLDDIILKISANNSFDYANGIVGIGNTLLFLTEEKFVDFDSDGFFNDLDKIVLSKLKSNIVVNFSHDTGIIGLSRYALNRPIKIDAVQHTLNQIKKGIEETICGINPVFLYPSEILQDIKLFSLEIGEIKEFQEQITTINKTIEYFEKNNSILQSSCSEYKTIQQLREAEIRKDNNKIKSLLTSIEKGSSDAVLQGLAYMNTRKPALPQWWKLY